MKDQKISEKVVSILFGGLENKTFKVKHLKDGTGNIIRVNPTVFYLNQKKSQKISTTNSNFNRNYINKKINLFAINHYSFSGISHINIARLSHNDKMNKNHDYFNQYYFDATWKLIDLNYQNILSDNIKITNTNSYLPWIYKGVANQVFKILCVYQHQKLSIEQIRKGLGLTSNQSVAGGIGNLFSEGYATKSIKLNIKYWQINQNKAVDSLE